MSSIAIMGIPHRTSSGELSIKATELPQLLAPCLHPFPTPQQEQERVVLDRHIELLTHVQAVNILRCRSSIVQYIRQFLLEKSFLEVETPILAATAGGAVARPFNTSATEFPDKQLSMRIAPELWLKRLIIGGFERIFEIGPAFRNEGMHDNKHRVVDHGSAQIGLDKTHNPEFTTCEFYEAYANLEDLIYMTEALLYGISRHISALHLEGVEPSASLKADCSVQFRRVDFMPAIETALGRQLPNLTSPEATSDLIRIFEDKSIPMPAVVSLPRLLDKLSSVYLEPQCSEPTFIMYHPECLSPLSKSFQHPTLNQPVAARAELFVDGKEIANTYEEENSPFEQRRKFMEQSAYREEGDPTMLNESYLQALQWGLPPTGGWGCGIDRLCMLFTGARRIGDVLSFGSLRSVTRHQD